MLDFKNIPSFNKSNKKLFYYPNQLGYKNFELEYKSYLIDEYNILSGYVSEIFEIKNTFLKEVNVIPDGCNDIIIIYDKNNIYSYISPSIKSIQSFSFSNKYMVLGIRFLPGATANILQEDMCNILGYTPKVTCFLQDFDKVEELIVKSTSFEQRCNIIISYLEQKFNNKGSKQLIIDYSINKIIISKGNYTIECLAEETGYSTRYIRKLFKYYVGHTPKELANIIRIQNMLDYISKAPKYNLVNIALNCGFADQSHMNRECKRYLNTTVGNIRSNEDWFNNLPVNSKRIFY